MATITITTLPAQDARIVTAFGKYLKLGRDATGPEVKAALIEWVKGIVQSQEFEDAKAAIVTSPVTPT